MVPEDDPCADGARGWLPTAILGDALLLPALKPTHPQHLSPLVAISVLENTISIAAYSPPTTTSNIMGSVTPQPASGLANDVLLFSVPFPPNEQWIARLESLHPGLKVRWAQQSTSFPPEPLPQKTYDDVTILVGLWPHSAELVQKVRYVQLLSAGADRWITHDLYKNPDVMFCTANGAHSYVGEVLRIEHYH